MTSARDRQIHPLAVALERAFAPVEPVFAEAGRLLAEAVGELHGIADAFRAMAGRMDDQDCAEAIAQLQELSRHLAGLADCTEASRTRLDGMGGQTDRLASRLGRLQNTIAEVRVLAVNAKIEAAHVTVSGIDFTVFTREIGRLAVLAGEELGRLGTAMRALQDDLNSARAALEAFTRQHRTSLAAVAGRLDETLAAVSRRRQDSAEAIRVLADISGHTAAAVAQAVQSLQIGDITRQRSEHIRDALATLMDILDGGSAALDPAHQAVLVASVCSLQSAQARHAAEAMEHDLAATEATLRSLAADIAVLPDRCQAAYSVAATPGASFLLAVGRQLEEGVRLLESYAAARVGVDRLVGDVAEVAAGMVGHVEAVQSIEAEMRVMGLNATFKCARLGAEGRALSIVAQELRAYSNRTAEDGHGIKVGIEQLIEAAHEMDAAERQGLQATQMEAAMAAGVQVLERAGADIDPLLATVARRAAAAAAALSRAMAVLAAHPEFAAALVDCSTALAALARDAEADAGGGDFAQLRAEILQTLGTRYTMASERKVHDLLFGNGNGTAPPPPTVDSVLF
ncbi:MAG: hypothetical protein HY985_04165 [Magnetospirillum sp.]|nr:hypothetical protein [Magnetospirillum sp.]